MGEVRVFLHRPLKGTVSRLTVKYEGTQWYAIFLADKKPIRRPSLNSIPDGRIRGGDLGLEKFLTLDNAESANYPGFLRQSLKKIRFLQGKLSRKTKGSKRYRVLSLRLARLHAHVRRQREDWQNKLVSELFSQADVLVLEKLRVEDMLRNHTLARSIQDASWGMFARKAAYKAEAIGRRVLFIDPWGTTQFCHNCLCWVPKILGERVHDCANCGARLARDLNSARLVKRLGILSYPPTDSGSSPAELRPLPSLRGLVSRSVEAGSHSHQ